jgi:hypothetical protein
MPSQSASDWFDGAAAHRVVRGSQYQNLEINLLGFAVGGAARSWNNNGICGQCGNSGGCGCGDCNSCGSGCAAYTSSCSVAPNMCGSRLNWTWLAGLRWFHFSDRLEYAASESDTTFNSDPDDLYYHNDVINNLFGIQLGGAGTYCLGKRFNVYGITKAGIYNNHSELETCLCSNGASAATATIVSDTAYNGQDYYVNTTQNNAAFLGELGTGLGIRISRGWSGNIGYRAIGASGVATAVNSIPLDMRHLGNVAEVNDTSSLLLHGLTLGGMYNF